VKSAKRDEIVKNGKNRLIYERYFGSKLLFSARKITKKKLFPTQPEKNDVKIYRIVEKKKIIAHHCFCIPKRK
jgi:hypothetical protein